MAQACKNSRNLVSVVGPTATGKSDLGLALAAELGGEVVNADAMQLYRGLDIGTAKLSPAERAGIRPEPGLVAEMIADAAHQPGALPLTQFALTELFERRAGRGMTLETYRELGGIVGALSTSADEATARASSEEQRAIRQVFLRLVTLGEGMTPLLPLPRYGASVGVERLLMKDEGLIPTGTFKARGAAVGVSRAYEVGVRKIAMPTNGNAGSAWAAYAARAGMEALADATPLRAAEKSLPRSEWSGRHRRACGCCCSRSASYAGRIPVRRRRAGA